MDSQKIDLEQMLDEIYTELENQKPPSVLVTRDETYWNNGFYAGRLNAMELVVQKLIGKSGEEIKGGNQVKKI